MATDLEKLREKFPFIEGFDQNLANVSAAAFGGNAPTQVETPEQINPTQVETPRQMSGIERRSGGASDPFAFLTSGPGGGRGSLGSTARPTTLPTSSPTLSPTPAPQVPVGQGTVLQTPQVPSMESVGLNPLTTEPQFGGVAQTPSLQPQFDAGVAETQARLGAMFGEAPQTLTQLTTGIEGAVMAQDAQGRMRTYESQEAADQALEAGMSVYDQESAAREARMGDGFSVRPGIDVPSLDMQRKRMEAGLSPTEGAPMGTDMSQQQQADMLERGFDPATGQKIGGGMATREALEQEGLRLKNAKTLAEINKIMQPSQAGLSDFEKEVDRKVAPQYLDWKQGGEARSQANIDKLSGVAKDLAEGQIDTRNISSLLPVGSEYMNTIFNPDLTDAMNRIRGVAFQSLRQTLGAQFTEKEGKNLVETYFNPALNEQQNLNRLNTFISTLTKAHEAQKGMFNYLESNNTLSGYSMDSSPRAIMDGLLANQGAGGSPIQGDVDVATAADEILAGK